MPPYRDYTVELKLKGPIITQFQSDTIFGHVCWALSFLPWAGDGRLEDFLALYDTAASPPLLVSDGFPSGYLPKPVLPPLTQKMLDGAVGTLDRVEKSHRIKAVKNLAYMPASHFSKMNEHEMDPEVLFKTLFNEYDTIAGELGRMQTSVVQHNTVDRIRNTVTEGLYTQEERFYVGDSGTFAVFIRTNHFSADELQKIFNFIGEQGYGKDKSTGKGHFGASVTPGIGVKDHENPNAFMTLSSYVPAAGDHVSGYYRILHKYGKLGWLFAGGSLDRNPFKKPLIMFGAGSTFYDDAYRPGKHYGSLLGDVHNNKKIRHYAYAFPLGIRFKDGL